MPLAFKPKKPDKEKKPEPKKRSRLKAFGRAFDRAAPYVLIPGLIGAAALTGWGHRLGLWELKPGKPLLKGRIVAHGVREPGQKTEEKKPVLAEAVRRKPMPKPEKKPPLPAAYLASPRVEKHQAYALAYLEWMGKWTEDMWQGRVPRTMPQELLNKRKNIPAEEANQVETLVLSLHVDIRKNEGRRFSAEDVKRSLAQAKEALEYVRRTPDSPILREDYLLMVIEYMEGLLKERAR